MIPMVLHCPECQARHVDAGDFATKPHHTHACQACGMVWRPAIEHTVGVQFLPGFKDTPPAAPAPPDRDPLGELASAVTKASEAIHRTAEKLRNRNAPASSADGRCPHGVSSNGRMCRACNTKDASPTVGEAIAAKRSTCQCGEPATHISSGGRPLCASHEREYTDRISLYGYPPAVPIDSQPAQGEAEADAPSSPTVGEHDEIFDSRPCGKCGDVFRVSDGGSIEENGSVYHVECYSHVVRMERDNALAKLAASEAARGELCDELKVERNENARLTSKLAAEREYHAAVDYAQRLLTVERDRLKGEVAELTRERNSARVEIELLTQQRGSAEDYTQEIIDNCEFSLSACEAEVERLTKIETIAKRINADSGESTKAYPDPDPLRRFYVALCDLDAALSGAKGGGTP